MPRGEWGAWRGRRPPWWPSNEPWPPQKPMWQMAPRRFFWRMAAFALAFFVFAGVVIGLVAGTVAHFIGGPGDGPGFFLPFPLLFLLLFAALVGSIASGRALRSVAEPLSEVMAAAAQVAGGDYGARVRPRGPRDVRALGESFNAMAARLEGAERQRRALLADVTHELRTPLTVVQAELEALLDGVHERDDDRIAALLDETRVMSRLVEDLRTLSTADAGALELHREPTDLPALVEDAAAAFRSRAAAAEVELAVELAADLPALEVDPVRVREVVSNLIDNALRHTPAGGRVVVSVARDGDGVAIEVRDTGSGIAPDVLPRIFDRFAKGPGSRGSGLGLAIARDLVRAHRGEIEATSDGPGRGTTVRFTLPLRA